MSVSAQETVFQHVGNGVTVTFAFGCQVPQASDLKVYLNDVELTSGYSVSGIGVLTGGTVTFDAAPANLAQVRLKRDIALERITDYQQNGDFLARVVNPDFNRLWMALQQHLTILRRALVVPKSDATGPAPLPTIANRANKLLSFDADGNPVAVAPAAQSAAALQALLAESAGASLLGYDNGTAQDVLDNARPLQNYTALRAYTGRATGVRLTTPGIAGHFQRDNTDAASLDNGITVIVAANGKRWKRDYSGWADPAWAGAVGDGVTNDAVALLACVASGLNFDLDGPKWATSTKLNFNKPGQTFRNGALVYLGDTTTRLLDISADDVRFIGITFDGNDKQPLVALGYLKPNIKRPQFYRCAVKNLTGRIKGTNLTNHMYGFLISPYGVQDFGFYACHFRDILKYNDGVTGGAAVLGTGFCGAIFAGMNDDLADPVAAQPIPTSGKIVNCVAGNIQTVLANGLSAGDRIGFDDADGIRFYGNPNGAKRLDITIENFKCHKVSKRGVKVSVIRGVIIDGLEVDGQGLPYFPVAVAKLESGTNARNLVGIAGSPGNAFYQGVELNGGRDVELDGLQIDYCNLGFLLDCVNDTTIDNVTVRRLDLRGVINEGFRRYYHAEITTQGKVSIEDSRIVCIGNNAVAILGEAAADNSGGLKVRNVKVVNGEVNLQGYGADVDGLKVKVTSSTYVGYGGANSALVRIGPGLGTPGCTVNNLHVDASGINPAYLSATRQWLVLLYSDKLKASNISLTVPQNLDVTYPHFDIAGNDLSIDGLTYDGPGRNNIATVVASSRWSIQNARRIGNGASTQQFLYTSNAGSSDGHFENIVDFRPTTASSIAISAGARFIVNNVSSKSSNASLVSHGGLAKTANVNTF